MFEITLQHTGFLLAVGGLVAPIIGIYTLWEGFYRVPGG